MNPIVNYNANIQTLSGVENPDECELCRKYGHEPNEETRKVLGASKCGEGLTDVISGEEALRQYDKEFGSKSSDIPEPVGKYVAFRDTKCCLGPWHLLDDGKKYKCKICGEAFSFNCPCSYCGNYDCFIECNDGDVFNHASPLQE